MNFQKTILGLALGITIFIFTAHGIWAQNPTKIVSDSLKTKSVQLSDISFRSAETIINTENILTNLISDENLEKLRSSNDSILNEVIQRNSEFLDNTFESNSIRYLETIMLRLKNQKDIVDKERIKLKEIVDGLDRSVHYINTEKEKWSTTREEILRSGYSENLVIRLDTINKKLSDALMIVSQTAEYFMESLDKNSELSITMGLTLNNIEKSISELKEQRLQRDYPDILNLDYSDENLKVATVFKLSLKTEWEELKSYLSARTNELFITLILFVFLLYIFYRNQSLFAKYQKNTENIYKRKLGVILSKPINSALLFALLLTIVVFPDRPPAFRELVIFLFVIPTIVLMQTLLDKKSLIFVYSFSFITLLLMVFQILPPENVIFRYNLLFVSLAEIYLIGHILIRTLNQLDFSKDVIALIRYLGIIFLLMSIIGFIGAITGNVKLSKSFLLAVSFTISASGLFYTAILVLKGLFISVIESSAAQNVNFVKIHGRYLKSRILQIINTATIFYVIYLLLERLSFWITVRDGVFGFLSKKMMVGEFQFSIGTILLFFVVIYISIVVGKIIQVILEGDILDRLSLKRGMSHTIPMMVKYTVIIFGVFLGISATGIQLNSMTVIIGAFSVGIGFGLQNIFNNIVSGLILLFDRPIKIGDTIEVGTLVGNVTQIGIRTSNIKTFDGAEVIVPNGQLISKEVINWTLSDQRRRIEVLISVSYKSDTSKVHDLLLEVLKQNKDIMLYPQPQVLFKQMGESSLDFRLLFWTELIGEWLRIQSEVTFKAFEKLKENNIEIPFPQRVIHIEGSEEGFHAKETP